MNLNRKIRDYLIINLPNFFHFIKRYLIKKSFSEVGSNFQIGYHFTFTNPENVHIGENVFINNDFYCSNEEHLFINDRVMFGPQCSVIGGDHKYYDFENNLRFNKKLGDNREILIEADTWIGHGSIILKRAKISEGTIIGAGSIVNLETIPYCIYAGNPARFIKPRFSSISELISYLALMEEKFNFKTKYKLVDLQAIYENS